MDKINTLKKIEDFPFKISLLIKPCEVPTGGRRFDLDQLSMVSTWLAVNLPHEQNNVTNTRYVEFGPEGIWLRCGFVDRASVALISLTWSEFVV